MNKRGYTSPYQEFCKDQRSLVAQLGLRGRDREKLLGVSPSTFLLVHSDPYLEHSFP